VLRAPPVSGKALPGIIESACSIVLISFGIANSPPDVLTALFYESTLPLGIVDCLV
jgi:hypothetical protein